MKAHSNITRFPKRKKPVKAKRKRECKASPLQREIVKDYYHLEDPECFWVKSPAEVYEDYLSYLWSYDNEIREKHRSLILKEAGLKEEIDLYSIEIEACSLHDFKQLSSSYIRRKTRAGLRYYSLKETLMEKILGVYFEAPTQHDKLRKAA